MNNDRVGTFIIGFIFSVLLNIGIALTLKDSISMHITQILILCLPLVTAVLLLAERALDIVENFLDTLLTKGINIKSKKEYTTTTTITDLSQKQ